MPPSASSWRTLYRDLIRAAPGAVSKNRQPMNQILGKIRQAFAENKHKQTSTELDELYEKGCNTLGFLKLAKEYDSVEHKLVKSILALEKSRWEGDIRPPIYKRKLMPLQKKVYEDTFAEYERIVENIERDLDIYLPKYQVNRSLEWIPPLKNLYKNDAAIINKAEPKAQEAETREQN